MNMVFDSYTCWIYSCFFSIHGLYTNSCLYTWLIVHYQIAMGDGQKMLSSWSLFKISGNLGFDSAVECFMGLSPICNPWCWYIKTMKNLHFDQPVFRDQKSMTGWFWARANMGKYSIVTWSIWVLWVMAEMGWILSDFLFHRDFSSSIQMDCPGKSRRMLRSTHFGEAPEIRSQAPGSLGLAKGRMTSPIHPVS